MKACYHCDRRFSKTEHLLRHQRSHTGEKPFTCSYCDRQYGRSDVLLRHIKLMHNQKSTSGKPKRLQSQRSKSSPISREVDTGIAIEQAAPITLDEAPLDNCMVTNDLTVSHPYHGHGEASVTSELDKLASASILLGPEAHGAPQAFSACGSMTRHLSQADLNVGTASLSGTGSSLQADHNGPRHATESASRENMRLTVPRSHVDDVDYSQVPSILNEESNSVPLQPFSRNDTFHGQDLHLGIDVFSILHETDSDGPEFMDFSFPFQLFTASGSPTSSVEERMSSVPAERFALVSHRWPQARITVDRSLNSGLWKSVAMPHGASARSEKLNTDPSPQGTGTSGSKYTEWGLDDYHRQKLKREFGFEAPGKENRQKHPQKSSSYSTGDETGSFEASFPSTRLLNLGLIAALRQPHCLVPFVHKPTFVARTLPSLELFSLCLLGLVLLDADKANAHVLTYLPMAIQKCCIKLAEPNFGPEASWRLISNLRSAILLLSAISHHPGERCDRQETLMTQMLYRQTITLAQVAGLLQPEFSLSTMAEFSVPPQTSSCSRDAAATNDDMRWRAWAHVESVKRLVATLLVIDSWYSYKLGTRPIISIHAVCYELPCSAELFQCSSVKSWKRLLDSGACPRNEPVVLQVRSHSITLPYTRAMCPIGMLGILCIFWMHIAELRHSMIPSGLLDTGEGQQFLIPSHIYAMDDSGKMLGSGLRDFSTMYGDFLRDENPSCIALWHFLNLQMLVNIEVLEAASGRHGVDYAHTALHMIASWSQTKEARRACLHAAGIYKAMNRRRIEEGASLHSEASVFVAALVLGLYVFMVHANDEDEHATQAEASTSELECYEILDDVNWQHLGLTGLPWSSDTTIEPHRIEGTAIPFVESGAPMSFMGTVCDGGYEGANMIFLEFANLLGDMGNSNVAGLCQILRIMSDTLVESEMTL